ncbi:hypothetical protein E4U38_004452 [Claviceps purpurea]|nr:hypothetical protein E4U38_004452 [Claviceps purpurea]
MLFLNFGDVDRSENNEILRLTDFLETGTFAPCRICFLNASASLWRAIPDPALHGHTLPEFLTVGVVILGGYGITKVLFRNQPVQYQLELLRAGRLLPILEKLA